MTLNQLFWVYPNYHFFGDDMSDTEHCVWAYNLEANHYVQFITRGNGQYTLEAQNSDREYVQNGYDIDSRWYNELDTSVSEELTAFLEILPISQVRELRRTIEAKIDKDRENDGLWAYYRAIRKVFG